MRRCLAWSLVVVSVALGQEPSESKTTRVHVGPGAVRSLPEKISSPITAEEKQQIQHVGESIASYYATAAGKYFERAKVVEKVANGKITQLTIVATCVNRAGAPDGELTLEGVINVVDGKTYWVGPAMPRKHR